MRYELNAGLPVGEVLTPVQAGELLGRKPATIRSWMYRRDGLARFAKHLNRVWITRTELERFLRSREGKRWDEALRRLLLNNEQGPSAYVNKLRSSVMREW